MNIKSTDALSAIVDNVDGKVQVDSTNINSKNRLR